MTKSTKLSSLTIDVRQGERVSISSGVTLELLHKSGQLARLRMTAPNDVKIVKEHQKQAPNAVPSMAS